MLRTDFGRHSRLGSKEYVGNTIISLAGADLLDAEGLLYYEEAVARLAIPSSSCLLQILIYSDHLRDSDDMFVVVVENVEFL